MTELQVVASSSCSYEQKNLYWRKGFQYSALTLRFGAPLRSAFSSSKRIESSRFYICSLNSILFDLYNSDFLETAAEIESLDRLARVKR